MGIKGNRLLLVGRIVLLSIAVNGLIGCGMARGLIDGIQSTGAGIIQDMRSIEKALREADDNSDTKGI